MSLAFPKTMRWGSGEHRFVRPVHSVVALLDDQVVDMEIAGVRSGRETFGHRTAGKPRIPLRDASAYLDALRDNGVIADVRERRATISKALAEAASGSNGRIAAAPGTSARTGADPDPELLDEVNQLVEWPAVLTGEFDPAFLDLPGEILMTSMRHHQKYFALQDASGAPINRFLSVANVKADPRGAIRRGHEWVLRARLTDARFFYEEDRKHPLESFGEGLARVAFHEKLGSYALKRDRIARLVGLLAPAFAAAGLKAGDDATARAAHLCKNDLTTQMVKEFPELEGIVGGLYARADRLEETIARAIYEHYRPRSLEDPIPATDEGALLSLADRIDTQAGIFLLGIVPTGSRDPYALRRSVQGACRILMERRVSLSLQAALAEGLRGYAQQRLSSLGDEAAALAALLEFYAGRQEYLAIEAGMRPDSVRAALAAGSDDPFDARLRMQGVEAFRGEKGFEDLAVIHKRIKNILREQKADRSFDPARLSDEAERVLSGRLEAALPAITEARGRRDYPAALVAVAGLREPLDRFFTEVMVLAEDPVLRENRIALLRSIAALFLQVGDLSEIATSSDRTAEADGARRRPAAARGARAED
jgi:glycyl-tRNA synthetase beta chain